ncbi:MAG: helix-turn-helix domain-containing protein [Anaerolineae bacterium]|nr:helix-turn-helix domain-containing protein [Anaerolineae bacterium]
MAIKFRLKELIAEKERREGVKITYRDLKEATGINLNTVTAMANNRMKHVGLNTIERLTDFFNCAVGDLIIKEADHSRPK